MRAGAAGSGSSLAITTSMPSSKGLREMELTLCDIENFGGVMFETLFREEVQRLYDQVRFRHIRRKLNVVFTSMVPWVADLPWEFAFDRTCRAFLATSDVRFVRNVLTPVPADNIPVRDGEPLRILVVWRSRGAWRCCRWLRNDR